MALPVGVLVCIVCSAITRSSFTRERRACRVICLTVRHCGQRCPHVCSFSEMPGETCLCAVRLCRHRLRTALPRIFLFNVLSFSYWLRKIETFLYLHFMLPLTFLALSTTTLEGLILGLTRLPYLTHWEWERVGFSLNSVLSLQKPLCIENPVYCSLVYSDT